MKYLNILSVSLVVFMFLILFFVSAVASVSISQLTFTDFSIVHITHGYLLTQNSKAVLLVRK